MVKTSVQVAPTLEADFTFAQEEPFVLESGGQLQPVTLRYAIYGDLEKHREKVVLACHALSGSARVGDWWDNMFGPGLPFDTERCCVLGINILGSCYGSSGPVSINPTTGKRYGSNFPLVSVGDIVRSQEKLVRHLGIKRLYAAVGASIGGMQALEWGFRFPERVERCFSIGTAPLNALGLALNHLQRQAIWNDQEWQGGNYEKQPAGGLGLARAIAMCSYKSGELFAERYGRKPNRNGEDPFTSVEGRFDVAGYLDHQEQVFLKRFDANSYIAITKLMDTWDVPKDPAALTRTAQEGVEFGLVGISSDWLFPPEDVRKVHRQLLNAGIESTYSEIHSSHGHDSFLAEPELLNVLIHAALYDNDGSDRAVAAVSRASSLEASD
jgi:homoserine O-acetyltransferase